MTVGSLFSGIGGLDLGLERAGMTVRWQVENNLFCQRVLAKHWPDVRRYSDVTSLTGEELEPVDLICGGVPCQPHSVANNRSRGGVDDARWLWPDMRRIVGAVRPSIILVENVTGIFTTMGFDRIQTDLAEMRFDCQWDCLPARFVGAPHERARAFIVGTMADADVEGLQGRLFLSQRAGQRASRSTGLDGRRIFDGPIGGTWPSSAGVRRVDDGVSRKLDKDRINRIKGLGNAVCVPLAEWIGRRILAVHEED